MLQALEKVKVVSIETSVSGPFCSLLLADLGAEVIKIENPNRGDVTREWDTVANGLGAAFTWLNRNKKSVTLNLKAQRGKEILFRLLKNADVFLQNLSPDAVARMKLTYEELKDVNSKLIYVGISGYGKTGPYKDKKAYDLLIQGETGVLLLTGHPEKPAKIPLSISDIAAGMYGALATVAALRQRDLSGVGQEIDISMFDALGSWLGYYPYYVWYRGLVPKREGLRHYMLSPYGPYLAKDGKYVNFAVLSNEDWKKFCLNVIEQPALTTDPRFANNEKRTANRASLETTLEQIFAQQNEKYWIEKLDAADIPYGHVNDMSELLKHPQLLHRELIGTVDSSVGSLKVMKNIMKMSGSSSRLDAIPSLGQHTSQVLKELGYGEIDIERFRQEDVV